LKAITTRYYQSTGTRPGRYVAVDYDGNIESSTQGHIPAVRALCQRMRWHGTLVAGEIRHGQQAFVWCERENTLAV
jgi:hypothetical protein